MQVYGVRELTTYLRELFDSDTLLGDLWVAGEVSSANRSGPGHTYFTLKDGAAQIRCVCFAKYGKPIPSSAQIENGAAIVAHGRMSLYEQRGDLQLYVDFVQPEGVGALQAEYERLKAQLEEQGLFDPLRKRPLPRFPARIGVVTSATGAVFHDICHVLERRWPLDIVLAPAPVQGADAPAGIVGAIEQLNRRGDIDVIIVARGGGSVEELHAFNTEAVARAIFASGVPTISAVGHETDVTIADHVADRRAATPSAAAEIVAPSRRDVSIHLGVAVGTLESILRERLAGRRASTMSLIRAAERREPDIAACRQRLDDVMRRAKGAVDAEHRRVVSGVGGCVWRLKALDPFATLDRGYAIVQRGPAVVSSVSNARTGDGLDVRVKDGTFGVIVAGSGSPTRSAARRPRRRIADAQAPLFTMPEERA